MGAKANGLSDREVVAQYPRWVQEKSNASMAANKQQIADIMARMTPEQRAMIEKQSGQSIESMMQGMSQADAQAAKQKR